MTRKFGARGVLGGDLGVFIRFQPFFITNRTYSPRKRGGGEKFLVTNVRAIVSVNFDDAKIWCSGGSQGCFGQKTGFLRIFFLIRVSKNIFSKIFVTFIFGLSSSSHIWAPSGGKKRRCSAIGSKFTTVLEISTAKSGHLLQLEKKIFSFKK